MKDKNIKSYAPPGTKDCLANCDREVVKGPKGTPVIVCHYCERIVRDIRNKN